MKIFIYGMQSSGASCIAYFLAQKPNSFAIVDLANNELAPLVKNDINVENIILKCTVSAKIPLDEQLNRFNPDKKILVLRHPFYNYSSLKNKIYAGANVTMEEKFALLEQHFNERKKFDLVVLYEDFFLNRQNFLKQMKQLDFGVNEDFYDFKRTPENILKYNIENSAALKECYTKKWAFGNIHLNDLNRAKKNRQDLVFKWISASDKKRVKKICPQLLAYYQTLTKEWKTPSSLMLIINKIWNHFYEIFLRNDAHAKTFFVRIDEKVGLFGIFLQRHYPAIYKKLKWISPNKKREKSARV